MINLVIALPCEARPLIRHFGLKKLGYNSYDVYTNSHIRLIVSGLGSTATANACAWLQGVNETPDKRQITAWLNIGIAGHASQPVGAALLAHSIKDIQSGQRWYPSFTFRLPCPTSPLLTVRKPEQRYGENCLFDMEATGFYSTCTRFATTELIHCLKIVSDNQTSGIENINTSLTEKLIQNHLPLIENLVVTLTTQQQQLEQYQQPPALYERCLSRWKFSHYQRKQLHQYLNRWHTLKGQQPWPEAFDHLSSASQVLQHLSQQTDQHPTRIGS